MTEDQQAPALRIVTPDATPEEIAALVAVFAALETAAVPVKKPAAAWSDNHRRLRPQHPHGPGGWRASSLPR
ncbi:MAG: hypothetical protein JWR52_1853 [Marmoricola sp.]|nr:hypothetical protein [Marmoricola sp.]MCW2856238.1 hypothetical protein [Marmoricola sp.]